MSSTYDEALKKFKKAFSQLLNNIDSKLNNFTVKTESFNRPFLTLKNNTVHKYVGYGINNLSITYPDGDFISSIILTTASTGEINIKWPEGTVFVGSGKPEFYPSETWEINVHNKRVACAQLYTE